MYSKFKYTPSCRTFGKYAPQYYTTGFRLYQETQLQVKQCLEEFICDTDVIDGDALKDHWFHIQPADIFISHSHNDLDSVLTFAGWLWNTFKLTTFIDYCSWGYCNDLLKLLDDKYSKIPCSNSYDYVTRNYTTSHVHMMLSTALTEMIDACECIIFFNTPQSISIKEEINKIETQNVQATKSPWIYHELSITSMLRRKKPERAINKSLLEHTDSHSKPSLGFEIAYSVNSFLQDMIDINDSTLSAWEANTTQQGSCALDTLYDLVK